MDIKYSNKRVEKFFSNWVEIYKAIGKEQSKSLKKRIDILKAASKFENVLSLKSGKLESLSGNLTSYYKMDLSKNYRLIFKPEKISDDIRDCIVVTIIGICDYHGQKEEWKIK